jgi:hypothetical protein
MRGTHLVGAEAQHGPSTRSPDGGGEWVCVAAPGRAVAAVGWAHARDLRRDPAHSRHGPDPPHAGRLSTLGVFPQPIDCRSWRFRMGVQGA